MLELSGKYFKATKIKILQKSLRNSSETNEKKNNILTTINKDVIKKEPNENFRTIKYSN